MAAQLESRILKYILIVISFLILHSALLIQPAHAQTSFPASAASSLQPTTYNLPATISPTSPLYTDLLVNNMFHTFSCLAVGQSFIGQPCLTYQVSKNAQGAIQSVPMLSSVNLSGGTFGAVTSLIGALYLNPPIRTSDYLASVEQNLGLVKEAQAQGVGSGAAILSPIYKLWQASRNISYLFMIVIFVIVGLMIMFRNRINPQTVITAQAALPGLVIGLILIYFSYFMAGLISDTAFVGTNLVGYYFTSSQGLGTQNLLQDIKNRSVLSIFTPFTAMINSSNTSSALSSIWDDLHDKSQENAIPGMDPQKILTALAGFITVQMLMPFGNLIGGIGQVAAGVVGGGITLVAPVQVVSLSIAFVATAILIYSMFKLLLRLINTYITIIFLTITAPFQFLVASLPGRQGIATGWILNMLANILVFPAILAVFYFVAFLLGPAYIHDHCPDIASTNPINPTNPCPFKISADTTTTSVSGRAVFPLFGGMETSFLNILLAFGILVASPSIPDIVVKAVGRMGQAGQLIGQELGAGIAGGRGYAGQFQGGTAGFAQQAGRLPGEKGLVYGQLKDSTGTLRTDISGQPILGWRRPEPTNPSEMIAGGTRAGQLTRIKAGATDFGSSVRGIFRK